MPKKLSYLFVSPHLDDALLSCGGLLSYLAKKNTVTVATVFTEAHNQQSNLSIRRFLKLSSERDSLILFQKRRKEDAGLISSLGANSVHLGFTDALYRLRPGRDWWGRKIGDLNFIYPLFSWQLKRGRVSDLDKPLEEQIAHEIRRLVKEKTVILAPTGIGRHMDHLLIRRVCEKYFPETIFWSDFPYNVRGNQFFSDLADRGYQILGWGENLDRKVELIKMLKTQVRLLFPDGNIPKVPEYHFSKQGVIPFPAVVGRLKPLTEENQYSEGQERDQEP